MQDKSTAINLSGSFQTGADMSVREEEILQDIISSTSFIPEKVIWRSSYWNTSQIGAVHYKGMFKNKPAVLKIQGVKPELSEIYMIEQLVKQNRSKVVRPPHIYYAIPWTDEQGYEALIMEFAQGPKVLEGKKLQIAENIHTFFNYYQEYRHNTIPAKPWLSSPTKISMTKLLESWIKNSRRAYPQDERRQSGDEDLAHEAMELLDKVYEGISLEFMCGHFSVEDLVYQDDEVILFSNLFWKWKYPFYDTVFGYHWFMYSLADIERITS
jgi:hypothetical protein